MNPIKQLESATASSSLRFRIAIALLILSVVATATAVIFSINQEMGIGWGGAGTTLHVFYLEDPDGSYTPEEIMGTGERTGAESTQALWLDGRGVRIGSSRSVWWARLRTDDLLTAFQGDDWNYFSILTPSLEQVALFLPDASAKDLSHPGYRMLETGWGVPIERHEDEGFSYPTFRLGKDLAPGQYVYLRMSSPYTQNHTYKLYTEQDFRGIQKLESVKVAFFLGFMVAIGINNFIQYATIGVSAHLSYLVYLLFLILYQGSVLGFYRLFLGKWAELLSYGIAPIGMAMFVSAMLFFRSVLETRKNFPLVHRFSWVVIILFALIFLGFLAGFRYEANLLTLLLANLTSLLILITTLLAMRRRFIQAKYLFAGWLLILLVSMVFNARALGLLPNTELTTFIILFPCSIEAVLFSLGVSELTNQIRREREQAFLMYQAAEGQVLSKESAFLQAQIRPHFLYNALNVIEALCYLDGRKAGELIQDLSKFLRHSFDFRNLKTSIDLREELEFIKAYVKIEQARFRNMLEVIYDLEDTEGLRLPPLLLQPLVENAIQHGIRSLGGSGTVTIRVRNLGSAHEITVEDDGIGMTEEQIRTTLSKEIEGRQNVGLANIQKRLQMFYGTELTIESTPGAGTRVTVLLPKNVADKSEG